jgi:hypothetical protein
MKLSESLALLNDLGITDWISRDTEESTRLVVNAIAGYFLESKDPYDFRPGIESDYVNDYFIDHSWEIDWFSILSLDFVEAVELNINSIALSINDSDPMMSVKETENYIESWVHEWRQNVRDKLTEEMGETAI